MVKNEKAINNNVILVDNEISNKKFWEELNTYFP
jgi:hypothetical protein